MNFIVTGGAGFIGNHLVKLLVDKGHRVGVIDNLCSGNLKNLLPIINKIEFYKTDILDYEKLKEIVRGVDGVFHQAGLTDVQESFAKKELYYKVNVLGTENILNLAKEFGFKVVFASSASVYGNASKIPISEDAQKNPLNPYGQTKLECEKLCEKYAKLGVRITVLRYFNVFGQGQNKAYAGVILKFLENLANKKPPVIHGNGSQTRDFVFVEDVAKANLVGMLSDNVGTFNVGSGTAVSIKDLAVMMIRMSGLDIKPTYDDALEGDVMQSQADITLIKKLNWKPQTSLEEWLRHVFDSGVSMIETK